MDNKLPDPGPKGKQAPASSARLQSLLERVCDQTVTAIELEELGELLAADKEVREYYLKYLSVHSSLQNHAWPADELCSCESCETDEVVIPRRRLSLRRMTAILATAATIAAAALGLYLRGNREAVPIAASNPADRRSEPEPSPVARVSQLSDDILWQSPNESVALHSHVSAGHILQLERGEM